MVNPLKTIVTHFDRYSVPLSPEEFTVGGDPEFEMVSKHTGAVVEAPSHLKPRHNSTNPNAKLGRDHAPGPLEHRPNYSTKAIGVISSNRNIVRTFVNNYPDFTESVASSYYSLGGHDHLGVGTPFSPPNELAELLDDFIGRLTLNLSSSVRKARSNYYRLSNFETKPWGFEYRTPPAAMWLTPKSARITLTIAKGVLQSFFTKERITYHTIPTPTDLCNINPKTMNYQDAKWWLTFIQNYKYMDKTDVGKYWLNKEEPYMPHEYDPNYDYGAIPAASRAPYESGREPQIHCVRDGPAPIVAESIPIPAVSRRMVAPVATIAPVETLVQPTTPAPAPADYMLIFSDDWDASVKTIMRSTIEDFMTRHHPRFNIILFGLAGTRGNVTNMHNAESTGMTRLCDSDLELPNLRLWSNSNLRLGLPYNFRMNTQYFRENLGTVLPMIEAEIKTKMRELGQTPYN